MFRTTISELKSQLHYYLLRRRIKIASLEETIEKIKNEHCSISRFGDGEFYIMEGNKIGFQNSSIQLSERLKEVICSDYDMLLVGISNAINPKNYREYTEKHEKWFKNCFKYTIGIRLKYLDAKRLYHNSLISRFWIPFRDKERAKRVVEQLKSVWEDRDIVVIEGEKTRMGVGSDLLDKAKSCHRILCPATNAFEKYDDILKAACSYPKDVLFMIALGPTATVLAYDLCRKGYQALDIGHVDLEYEWMRMGATEQVDLPDRYVNEQSGGDKVVDVTDKKYLSEIDYRIQ